MGIMFALNMKDRGTIKLVFVAFCTTTECVVICLLANVFTASDIGIFKLLLLSSILASIHHRHMYNMTWKIQRGNQNSYVKEEQTT